MKTGIEGLEKPEVDMEELKEIRTTEKDNKNVNKKPEQKKESREQIAQESNVLYGKICKFLSQQYDSGNNNPTTKQLLLTVMNANSQQKLHPLDLALFHAINSPKDTLKINLDKVQEFVVHNNQVAFKNKFLAPHNVILTLNFAQSHLAQFVQLHPTLPFLDSQYYPQFAFLGVRSGYSHKHFVIFQNNSLHSFAALLLHHDSRTVDLVLPTYNIAAFLTVLSATYQFDRGFLIRK